MSTFNLLKYRDKRICAKTDIAYGRLRLLGPRYEIVYDQDGGRVPLVRGRTGPTSHGLVAKPGHTLQAAGYNKVKTSEPEEADVSQEVAFNLVVKERLADLINGGAFSVIEQRDGAHLIEQWYPPTQYGGPVHSLFNSIEKIETLVPDYFVTGSPVGTQIRVRATDFFQACNPRNLLWLDEEADPPCPDGTGNSNHRFRILRPSPVSKAVALKQQEQSGMLRALWEKTFPGQPIGAAK